MPPARRGGVSPILIVAGTVLAVVVLSWIIYSVGDYKAEKDVFATQAGDNAVVVPTGACGLGTPDDRYSVAVETQPDPPRAEGTTFRLTVRRDGAAVTGAKVCLTADMPDMQHPGVNTLAKESPGGTYETALRFSMGGSWRGAVTIAEPGQPSVSVRVRFEVAQPTGG